MIILELYEKSKAEDPKFSARKLIEKVEEDFGIVIGRTTLNKWLREKEKILKTPENNRENQSEIGAKSPTQQKFEMCLYEFMVQLPNPKIRNFENFKDIAQRLVQRDQLKTMRGLIDSPGYLKHLFSTWKKTYKVDAVKEKR